MAITRNKLTARGVAAITEPGKYSDGGNLYLVVSGEGSAMRRRWLYFYRAGGKRREMGLGGYPDVPLADARRKRDEAEKIVTAGGDPIKSREEAKKTPEAVPTFGAMADSFIAGKSPEWRNDKHAAQWTMTLTKYCRAIRKKPVDEIETSDVLAVLKPLWQRTPETASRLRGRIEAVLDAATALGHIPADKANPARWKGHLAHLLPKRTKLSRGHHAAMNYAEIPQFMALLRERDAVAARALEFCVLTAARTGEVIGATWDEIDTAAAVWTIPARRMKAGATHRVPLCDRALDIVNEMKALEGAHVFPGRSGNPLSNMAMEMVLRRLDQNDATVHGMRSSFRDWAGETTHFPREVCEAALAHTLQGVEAAYRRGDALEKRRALMNAWGQHCLGSEAENVLKFSRAQSGMIKGQL